MTDESYNHINMEKGRQVLRSHPCPPCQQPQQWLNLRGHSSADAANAEAARISPDGGTIGNTIVDWVAPPHFYKAGKIIVLYVGSADMVIQPLIAVLGSQFAGRSP